MIRTFLAVWIIAATQLHADLAPAEHTGYGISPVKAKGLRMLSAQVDITWGSPCTLTGTFVIDNRTTKPIDTKLGFPIERIFSNRLQNYVPQEMTFAFDGVPMEPASIAVNDPITEKLRTTGIKKVDTDIEWDDAGLVKYLNDESKKSDPDHKGIKFVLRISPGKAKLTKARGKQRISWANGNFAELLGSTNFKWSVGDGVVYLDYADPPSDNHRNDTNDPDGYTWYRCQHTFPPGQTKVTVTSKYPVTLTYSDSYHERILYCIETGGYWEGTIGSEEVDLHFPHPVVPGQIFNAHPENYTVDGSTVRWLFKDFKPSGKDHDIDIEYLRPDVANALVKARAQLARDPSDPNSIIKLAKNLFSVGPYIRGSYAPGKLSPQELNQFMAKIESADDRATFHSFYSLNDKGKYELVDNQWQKNANGLRRILNSIDYQDPYFRSPEVKEARSLIEKLLQDHPDNAEAWNVYLANYYRFHFDSVGVQMFGQSDYYPDQIEQIKKAVSLCPKDPCLQYWLRNATGKGTDSNDGNHGPDKLSLYDELKKRGYLDNDFLKISYDWD